MHSLLSIENKRKESVDLRDVVITPNTPGISLNQDKIEEYMKVMSLSGNEKENAEKLAAMWMYAAQMGSTRSLSATGTGTRPIMLIPAGSTTMLASSPSTPLPPPPTAIAHHPAANVVPGMAYRGGLAYTLPYMRPGPVIYAPAGSVPGTYRIQKSAKLVGPAHRRRRMGPPPLRTGKMNANRRQRRKSEADIVDEEAFQYTGLDRDIADNFLARQEQSNSHAGSHLDYSSSSTASETYGKPKSRSSSKTKIVCRDVVM